MASVASAPTTSPVTTTSPRSCCTISDSCKAKPHDLPAAFDQCHAQCALRGAAGMGLPADSAQADRAAPPRDEDRVCHFVSLSGVLPGLSCAGGIGAVP